MCHATSKVEDAAAEMLYERLGEAGGGRGRRERRERRGRQMKEEAEQQMR